MYDSDLAEQAYEIEQYWTFNETSKNGTITFKPQNRKQEILYWEYKNANLDSFYGPSIAGPILFIFLIIIILGYLLCNYVFLTSRFNELIIGSFYLWIILVICFFYSMYLDDQKRFALRERVEEEIPHN